MNNPAPNPFTSYVLGFLFDRDGQHVALIKKEKPAWQRGLYNGIGGRIEPFESPHDAMIRECEEETNSVVSAKWREFAQLKGACFIVHCFSAFDTAAFSQAKTTTAERIVKFNTSQHAAPCVSNMP